MAVYGQSFYGVGIYGASSDGQRGNMSRSATSPALGSMSRSATLPTPGRQVSLPLLLLGVSVGSRGRMGTGAAFAVVGRGQMRRGS